MAGSHDAAVTVLDELVDRVDALRARRPRVLVGVDGPDAAGKTTLADALRVRVSGSVLRASIDGFHNRRDVRLARGAPSPEGYFRDGFDLDRLSSRLLAPFAAGRGASRPMQGSVTSTTVSGTRHRSPEGRLNGPSGGRARRSALLCVSECRDDGGAGLSASIGLRGEGEIVHADR